MNQTPMKRLLSEVMDEQIQGDESENVVLLMTQGPPDKHKVVYMICLLLGVGVLYAWNAFITPYDYFHMLYPEYPFEFIFSVTYNFPCCLFLIAVVKWGDKFSYTWRIVTPLVMTFIALIVVPCLDFTNLDTFTKFTITLVCIGMTGVAAAMLFASLFNLVSIFPPLYPQSVMSGNGVAGVIVAILRILTKATLPDTPEDEILGSRIYFFSAAAIMLLCIVGFFYMMKTRFVEYHLDNANQESGPAPSIMSVLRHSWKLGFLVWFVFFVTLALFPGVTSLIQGDKQLKDWFQIWLISTFMIGDFIGRSLPSWKVVFDEKSIWAPVLIRAIFFPLFILCVNPHILVGDVWAFILMSIFSISNGYTSTVIMMLGPQIVPENMKSMTGTLLSFFLNFGLVCGVSFSFALLAMVS